MDRGSKTNIEEEKIIRLVSAYVPGEDITIIMEHIIENGVTTRSEIKGWYYGTPDKYSTDIFKNKGVICTYGNEVI